MNQSYVELLQQRIKFGKEVSIINSKIFIKTQFIMPLIDEIQEISYYEATQLKKKLGDIYVDWTSENPEEEVEYCKKMNETYRKICDETMKSLLRK
jgi:hypothetical protein